MQNCICGNTTSNLIILSHLKTYTFGFHKENYDGSFNLAVEIERVGTLTAFT